MSEIFGQQAVRVPDVAEPIRAYRAWSVSHLGLKGYGETIWPRSQPLAAACVAANHSYFGSYGSSMPGPHDCPSPTGSQHAGYGCGIYAYKSLDALMGERWVEGGGGFVFGEVLLWGDVYEHANGYRAQHAKPVTIYDLPLRAGIVTPAMLAGFYDVPLVKPDLDVDELDLIALQREESYAARMTPSFTSTSGTITSSTATVSYGGTTFPVAGSSITFALEDEPRKRARRSRFWLVYAAAAGAQGGTAIVDLALGSPVLAAAMSAVCGVWTWLAVKEWRDG